MRALSLAALVVGALVVGALEFGPMEGALAEQLPSDAPCADVVVALGVRPVGQYTPSPGMMSNLLTSIALLEQNKAKRLMVCGGYTRGHIAEAEMMAILAQGLGIPLDRIAMENGSVDTEENARNAALLSGRQGFKSAILVAQKDHVGRAARLFREAGAFKSLVPVVGELREPEFPSAVFPDVSLGDKFDAIVVHGVSPGYDFSQDELAVDGRLVSMLSTASALYRQGMAGKVILWHPLSPRGHIRRTEVMAILLAAMGVPEGQMILGSSRRYEGDGQQIPQLCARAGAKRVLALVPPDTLLQEALRDGRTKDRDIGGPASAAQATEMYRKAGIAATVVTLELH